MVSIKGVQAITKLSPKAAGELVNLFVDNGFLQEVSNQQRNRAFAFTEYLDIYKIEKKQHFFLHYKLRQLTV